MPGTHPGLKTHLARKLIYGVIGASLATTMVMLLVSVEIKTLSVKNAYLARGPSVETRLRKKLFYQGKSETSWALTARCSGAWRNPESMDS
jgi:hypothetical protein